MDRLSLNAQERIILGKKVKKLRQNGKLPAHVFGKNLETEAVTVVTSDFLKIFKQIGETGLIDLKIGQEKVRPVLIREIQYHPVTELPIHIDFYQVNLSQKVKVAVPLVLIGEQPESIKMGEAIVLQTINEIEVEALPTDLIEKIEVDISLLKNIDDAITIAQLQFDRSKLTINTPDEEVVVKLAPAVSAEMEKLLEEQAAETLAAAAEEKSPVDSSSKEAEGAEGEAKAEGETVEGAEGEEEKEGETAPEGKVGKEDSTRAQEESKKAE